MRVKCLSHPSNVFRKTAKLRGIKKEKEPKQVLKEM